MELSGLQVVITVILIVVAGGIALVCDYLRHRAQRLRELAVELKVRSEIAATAATLPPPAAQVTSAASAAASRNARIREQYQANSEPIAVAETRPPATERHSTETVAPALASAAEITSVRGTARKRRRPVPPADAPLPRLDDMNPRQALSAWLDQRAAARPATPTIAAAPEPQSEPEAAAAELSTASNVEIGTIVRRALAARSKTKTEPVQAMPEAIPSAIAPADPITAAADAFLWTAEPRMVFDRVEARTKRFEVIAGAASAANSFEVSLPDGMHDYAVLERAIAAGKTFNGLVISIAVSEIDGRTSQNADVMNSVGFFIRGLLNNGEFACRSAEDEFLVIGAGLEKAEAERRLNQVAEQLWDYQLRGVSTWSLLFSWGGVDVYQTRLSEAIAMAAERMTETRRGRKTVSMESARARTRAAV